MLAESLLTPLEERTTIAENESVVGRSISEISVEVRMRILGINGSPHDEGNTGYALRYGLSLAEQEGVATQYVWLGDRQIGPCKACFACIHGDCPQRDDMPAMLESLRACDGVILASPVYVGMVTGPMKTMMDRTVPLRARGLFELSGKIGGGIACGGFRNGGQELTLQCMHTFLLQQDMQAVADGPPFSHSGAAIVGTAKDDVIGLQTVRNLVQPLIVGPQRA
jgi:multimeric flavodoxin WrbA